MPEQLVASIPGQFRLPPSARRLTWSLACVLPLCGMPAAAFGQGAPAGLRACAAETDSAQRLACYDREMARLGAQPARPAAPVAGATQPALPSSPAPQQAQASAPAEASAAPAAQAPSAAPAQESRPAAAKSADAGPDGGSSVSWKAPWKIFSGGGGAWRLTAHVASLDRWPDAMVLHLDNGQVWRQVGRASGDLGLKTGDSVTIEKHLGSYWLSSRHVSNMKVRLDSGSGASN